MRRKYRRSNDADLLEDGERLRVPLFAMDAMDPVQRAVARGCRGGQIGRPVSKSINCTEVRSDGVLVTEAIKPAGMQLGRKPDAPSRQPAGPEAARRAPCYGR